jgi:hypothetical protein
MAHGDRMKLEIKGSGERVVITVKRSEIVLSKNKRKATITYKDSPVRGKTEGY